MSEQVPGREASLEDQLSLLQARVEKLERFIRNDGPHGCNLDDKIQTVIDGKSKIPWAHGVDERIKGAIQQSEIERNRQMMLRLAAISKGVST